ncbi:MAG: hypothetical protein H0T09_03095 [Actinobacteria bacterium]|nr:hypothetical protein [Actinomycetota bacterium]
MSERDDNIEFDFFDDDQATQETAVGDRGGSRRGGPRRPLRAPTGITPLLRLIGLVAFAILIVVLLVFWAQSCRGASKREAYRDYMKGVTEVARSSDEIGRDLTRLLTSPRVRQASLETSLSRLAERQRQVVRAARRVDSPGRLRPQHEAVVEALQFRVSGLRGLEDAFRQTARSRDAKAAGELLGAQGQRLLTSDVVWDDRFKVPAADELERQKIRGVQVPDSNFVSNGDLFSASGIRQVWRRIHGGATTGGTPCKPRGTGIVSLRALPQNAELSQDDVTTVIASTNLAFQATIKDTGCSQEVRVRVTLTIPKSPEPIVLQRVIDIINPGQEKTVTFRNIGQPPFDFQSSVKLDVQPVSDQETNTTNNSAEYPVVFSLED